MPTDTSLLPPTVPAATPKPLLVRVPEAGRLGGVSEATWHRLRAAGRTPAPLRLGGSAVWRMEALRELCAAGCSPCAEWDTGRAVKHNGRPCG
jgi:predicted DNA-binding transcriptional regulator AlpA